VNAEAVAGFTLMACDITPMFFCLPEPGLDVFEGQMIKMVSQGGGEGNQWGPGNFGFLEAGGNVGIDPDGACDPAPPGQEDVCALAASQAVSLCFAQTGVTTRPGLGVGNMIAGLNTRFDQYDSASGQFQNDRKYDPDNFAGAANVLDGWITRRQGNQCRVDPSPPPYDEDGNLDPEATVGLPLDDCFSATTGGCDRIGDGNFEDGLREYLTVNYGVEYPTELDDDGEELAPVGIPAWLPDGLTRYEIYQAENANSVELATILEDKLESSLPNCQPPSTPDPRRRVIIAAGINCGAHEDELNGGSGVIPVKRFVEMFLVRPAETDGTGAAANIYGEVIQSVGSGPGGHGEGGILHDVVQLYE